MSYKFAPKANYEDYASGRVIYHQSGLSTFPVRLASEIFLRAMSYLEEKEELTLYDPLCGEGYVLTVLGLLHGANLTQVIGSDINSQALETATKNLSLLAQTGLDRREEQLSALLATYQKPSHQDALKSIERFIEKQKTRKHRIENKLFKANLLKVEGLAEADFQPDIIITDLPYGNMVSWEGSKENAIPLFLENISTLLHPKSVVAIAFDKSQKVSSPLFHRLEKFQVGKRRVEVLRLNP